MVKNSLKRQLRLETQSAHQQLDQWIGKQDLFASPSGYQLYLTSMYHAYQFTAEAIGTIESLIGLPPLVSRLQASLLQDLNVAPANSPNVPQPELTSIDAQWGATYVMEGSAMGARMLIQSLPTDNQHYPTNYFRQLIEHSSERWPRLIEGLNESGGDPAITIQAAKDTFQFVYQCFLHNAETVSPAATTNSPSPRA